MYRKCLSLLVTNSRSFPTKSISFPTETRSFSTDTRSFASKTSRFSHLSRQQINTMKSLTVEGYEELNKVLKEQSGKVYVLFSGSPNEDGVSWCPDCVKADPVISRNFDKGPADAVLIHCLVGDRAYWKNPSNEFRKDPKFAIRCVPTLLKLGSRHKLEEEQCCKDDLIQMMFEDEDD